MLFTPIGKPDWFNPRPGPRGEPDALSVSMEGQAVDLEVNIVASNGWSLCCWIHIQNGRLHRPGFEQPEDWREGEHALVCSQGDDQQASSTGPSLHPAHILALPSAGVLF